MRCAAGPMPPEAMAGGVLKDAGAASHALKQLLARTEVTEQRAFVAVSDALATFRILHLPKTATEQDVVGAVAREMPLDPERIVTRWVDLASANERRIVYAAAWDRGNLKVMTDAVRSIGVEPVVVELKSAAVARAVAEPSCVVVDLASDPAEIVLVDGYVPQVWHSVAVQPGGMDDLTTALSPALRSVLRFYRRRHDIEFSPTSPVFISGEQVFTEDQLRKLAFDVGQPVAPLPTPSRVPPHVRLPIYLTCLGLIMRRSA